MMKYKFNFKNIKGDLLGGITAGVVALPLALAFGVASGLGASFGLYGAIFIGFFAALFGGTETQISGPTAPMTAVSMVVIAGIVASFDGNIQKALPTIMVVFLVAGIIQILMGIAGLGKYIKYIPYPVVSGFMTAIGILILVGQLFPTFGYYPDKDAEFVNSFKPQAEERILDKILHDEAKEGILVLDSFEETIKRSNEITPTAIQEESMILAKRDASGVIGTLKNLPNALKNINKIELLLALLTVFIIYGFKRITSVIPSTLIALIAVSFGAFLLQSKGIIDYVKISEIPGGFPDFFGFEMVKGFDFASFKPFISAAISLAFLGAIDSLLTSLVADNMTKTKHNPNQELIGQGIGNSIAAMFKGIPGAGATIRTVVNIKSGGRTRLSGMIAAILLLIISLFISDAASQIPKAVLAGILITVGFGVMDYKGLKAIPNLTKTEIFIMFTVMLLSVFWDLIFAVGIGLVISSLAFMKKMGDITAKASYATKLADLDKEVWDDEKDFPKQLKEEVYIKHLDGPLFFGYVTEFQDLASHLPDYTKYVVFRMCNVPHIDQSGLYALEEILIDFKKKGKIVIFSGLNEEVEFRLNSMDIIPNLVSNELCFKDFKEALNWIKSNVKNVV